MLLIIGALRDGSAIVLLRGIQVINLLLVCVFAILSIFHSVDPFGFLQCYIVNGSDAHDESTADSLL